MSKFSLTNSDFQDFGEPSFCFFKERNKWEWEEKRSWDTEALGSGGSGGGRGGPGRAGQDWLLCIPSDFPSDSELLGLSWNLHHLQQVGLDTCGKPWVCPHHHRQALTAHCDLSTQGIEAEDQVHGHPCLDSDFETSLRPMRLRLKETTKNRKKSH